MVFVRFQSRKSVVPRTERIVRVLDPWKTAKYQKKVQPSSLSGGCAPCVTISAHNVAAALELDPRKSRAAVLKSLWSMYNPAGLRRERSKAGGDPVPDFDWDHLRVELKKHMPINLIKRIVLSIKKWTQGDQTILQTKQEINRFTEPYKLCKTIAIRAINQINGLLLQNETIHAAKKGKCFESEVWLSKTYEWDGMTVCLGGFADGVTVDNEICEVKVRAKPLRGAVPARPFDDDVAQLATYLMDNTDVYK